MMMMTARSYLMNHEYDPIDLLCQNFSTKQYLWKPDQVRNTCPSSLLLTVSVCASCLFYTEVCSLSSRS